MFKILKRGHTSNKSTPFSTPTSSPPTKMATNSTIDQQLPAPPCSFSPTMDLNAFASQLLTIYKFTNAILPEVQSAGLKACLQQLTAITKSCGYFLTRELSISVSRALESDRRSHSLVVSNLVESTNESATMRAKEDQAEVCKILDVLDIETVPTATYRMGRRIEGAKRPRLLKVELPRRADVTAALRNRSKLSSIPYFKSVHLRMSMSDEEREEYSKLVIERNKLNAQLSEDERKSNRYIVYANMLMRANELDAKKKERQKNSR